MARAAPAACRSVSPAAAASCGTEADRDLGARGTMQQVRTRARVEADRGLRARGAMQQVRTTARVQADRGLGARGVALYGSMTCQREPCGKAGYLQVQKDVTVLLL